MIKLNVQDYCHECPYFDAVMVPEYCNKSSGAGCREMVPSGDVLIKCKSWIQCQLVVGTALRLKDENHEKNTDLI